MAEAEEGAQPAQEGGGGLAGKLIFVVLGLCLLNLGGTGFVAMKLMKPLVLEQPKQEQGEAIGHTVELDPFVVNLNEAGVARYLKLTLELELRTPKHAALLDNKKSKLRSELLLYLSDLRVADTLGFEAKQKVHGEVTERIKNALEDKEAVKAVFFKDFVVQ